MSTNKENTPPISDVAQHWAERPLDRRAMLRAAGLGGAALALAACGEQTLTGAAVATARKFGGTDGNVILDFSSDIDVLNYAYALEQLEAAFYVQVVATSGFTSRFAANEQRLLTAVRDHEVVHREFLKTALGAAAIPGLTPNFSSIDFTSRSSVLNTAQTFEDLGVGAYNGAAKYLANVGYLLVAGKIVSVEARHASAIRDVLSPRSGSFAPNTFDPAMTPTSVLSAAQSFIVQTITVINS